jgi:hypothetical protein
MRSGIPLLIGNRQMPAQPIPTTTGIARVHCSVQSVPKFCTSLPTEIHEWHEFRSRTLLSHTAVAQTWIHCAQLVDNFGTDSTQWRILPIMVLSLFWWLFCSLVFALDDQINFMVFRWKLWWSWIYWKPCLFWESLHSGKLPCWVQLRFDKMWETSPGFFVLTDPDFGWSALYFKHHELRSDR